MRHVYTTVDGPIVGLRFGQLSGQERENGA